MWCPPKNNVYNDNTNGHELQKLGTMEHDAKVKRAIFIQNSTDIGEMFKFAHPAGVLQAMNVYASHFYGSKLCLNPLINQSINQFI